MTRAVLVVLLALALAPMAGCARGGAGGGAGGGDTQPKAGVLSEKDRGAIMTAIDRYVYGAASIQPDRYQIEGLQSMDDSRGAAWAAAQIVPNQGEELDPALVIMKRAADGAWKGVYLGTGGTAKDAPGVPPEVRRRFFSGGS